MAYIHLHSNFNCVIRAEVGQCRHNVVWLLCSIVYASVFLSCKVLCFQLSKTAFSIRSSPQLLMIWIRWQNLMPELRLCDFAQVTCIHVALHTCRLFQSNREKQENNDLMMQAVLSVKCCCKAALNGKWYHCSALNQF